MTETNTAEATAEAFNEWAAALEAAGEAITERTGDALPALSAHLGVCYVIGNNGVISDAVDDEQAGYAQEMLSRYSRIMPGVVSTLTEAGWITPEMCEGCGCGAIVPMPAFPEPCDCCAEEPLSEVEELERQLSDLIVYADSLGGSPEGYREFCRTVLYPVDGDG
jgi:hypothetical protein